LSFSFAHFYAKLTFLGTQNRFGQEKNETIRFVNEASLSTFVFFQFLVLPFLIFTNQWVFTISLGSCFTLSALALNALGRTRLSKYFLLYSILASVAVFSIYRGLQIGVYSFIPILIILCFVFFRQNKWELFTNLSLLGIIFFIGGGYFGQSFVPIQPFSAEENKILGIIILWLAVVISILLGNSIFNLFSRYAKTLEAVNETQNMVFSIIGHDLKNPLVVNLSLTDMIMNRGLHIEEFWALSGDLHRNNQMLLQTLNNLLYWGASQMHGFTSKFELIDPSPFIVEIHKLYQYWASTKKINLVLSDLPIGSTIYADKNQFELVLRNLVSNAIKFSKPGGKVEISCKKKDVSIRFSVMDEGKGFSMEDWNRINTDQISISRTGSKNEVGTGIGLTLVMRMLDAHKSQLKMKPKENGGTTFYFDLPLKMESPTPVVS